jgi:hypothetical protein
MNAGALREKWLPLLQRLLACLRRSRETPLQFEIDSASIVSAALADHPSVRSSDAGDAIAALNQLVAGLLADDELPVLRSHGRNVSLARWVDEFYRGMRSVHALAIDIIALRVEGFEPRDIAEKLGLGLRQVRSILREMRTSWAGQSEFQ